MSVTREAHDFDPLSNYCRRCGVAAGSARDAPQACHQGVVAISHILCRRRMAQLVGAVLRHRLKQACIAEESSE